MQENRKVLIDHSELNPLHSILSYVPLIFFNGHDGSAIAEVCVQNSESAWGILREKPCGSSGEDS